MHASRGAGTTFGAGTYFLACGDVASKPSRLWPRDATGAPPSRSNGLLALGCLGTGSHRPSPGGAFAGHVASARQQGASLFSSERTRQKPQAHVPKAPELTCSPLSCQDRPFAVQLESCTFSRASSRLSCFARLLGTPRVLAQSLPPPMVMSTSLIPARSFKQCVATQPRSPDTWARLVRRADPAPSHADAVPHARSSSSGLGIGNAPASRL